MNKIFFIAIALVLVGGGCTPQISQDGAVIMSNEGLIKLPESLFLQTGIEELDISSNRLTGALPGEIKNLQKLRKLNASNNQFTGIPAEIGQITSLEVLDFSNNNITGLPLELGNLQNLKILNLTGNNVSEFDLEKIRKELPPSVQILK